MPAVVMDVSTDNSVTHEEQKKVPETKVLAPKKWGVRKQELLWLATLLFGPFASIEFKWRFLNRVWTENQKLSLFPHENWFRSPFCLLKGKFSFLSGEKTKVFCLFRRRESSPFYTHEKSFDAKFKIPEKKWEENMV
jgi:hypothetical protein